MTNSFKSPSKSKSQSKSSAKPELRQSTSLAGAAGKLKATAAPYSLPKIMAARANAHRAHVDDPTNTRERILFAAVEILNTKGFGALTQTCVAERAGVRQSHLTYYFPVRNDLLRETAVYGCNAMLDAMSSGIDSGAITLTNFREFLTADIHDRRFARLMSALIVASDEDDRIKPWLASFEEANRERLQDSFHKLGIDLSHAALELFHATMVGALILDLGESTAQSLIRTQRIIQQAFDLMLASAQPAPIKSASAKNIKKVENKTNGKTRKKST